MRFNANFAIIGAAWAINVKAQSNNCGGTASGLLDRGFAAFKGSEPNFHDFVSNHGAVPRFDRTPDFEMKLQTSESGEALSAMLQEVSATDLIKCIDECVSHWPPVDQIDAPLKEQYSKPAEPVLV